MFKLLSNQKLTKALALLGALAAIAYIPFSFMFLESPQIFTTLLFLFDIIPVVVLSAVLLFNNGRLSKKAIIALFVITLLMRVFSLMSGSTYSTNADPFSPDVEKSALDIDLWALITNGIVTTSPSYEALHGESYPPIFHPFGIFVYDFLVLSISLWFNKVINILSIIVISILFVCAIKRKRFLRTARTLSLVAFIATVVLFVLCTLSIISAMPITHTKMMCTVILGHGIIVIFFCLLAMLFSRMYERRMPTGEEKARIDERLSRIEAELAEGEITREIYELKREIILSDYDY